MICYAAERRESPESHMVERRSGRGCVCANEVCVGLASEGAGWEGWRCGRCIIDEVVSVYY